MLPPREDLQPAGSTRLSDKPPEEVKISKAQITRQKIAEMKADENKVRALAFKNLILIRPLPCPALTVTLTMIQTVVGRR